ncbi:MAG: hypothetical protein ACQERX_06005 [Bacillota bacterium]
MQTKFDIGDNVKTKDGVHDKNLYGEISGIQIGKDKEKYSVTTGDECKVYDKDELTEYNLRTEELLRLVELIEKDKIDVIESQIAYGDRLGIRKEYVLKYEDNRNK